MTAGALNFDETAGLKQLYVHELPPPSLFLQSCHSMAVTVKCHRRAWWIFINHTGCRPGELLLLLW